MTDKLSDLLSTLGVQESDELFAIYNEEEYNQLIAAAEALEQRVEGMEETIVLDADEIDRLRKDFISAMRFAFHFSSTTKEEEIEFQRLEALASQEEARSPIEP